jgi:hypothetical protein
MQVDVPTQKSSMTTTVPNDGTISFDYNYVTLMLYLTTAHDSGNMQQGNLLTIVEHQNSKCFWFSETYL